MIFYLAFVGLDSIKEIQDPEHDGMKDLSGLMGKKRQTVFLSLFQLKLERPTIRFDDGISERDRIYRRLKLLGYKPFVQTHKALIH